VFGLLGFPLRLGGEELHTRSLTTYSCVSQTFAPFAPEQFASRTAVA
jgi:hypothetical protein